MAKKSDDSSSQLELLVRIPYFIAFYIVLYMLAIVIGLWGIWTGIMFVLNWFYILFTGKRAKFMHEQIHKWYNFAYKQVYIGWVFTKCMPYFLLLTDKRPGFNI
jgi:hypothetical protein